MSVSPITTYLKYTQLQVVAEAFLTDKFTGELLQGTHFDDALLKGNKHTSRLTQPEIDDFQAHWQVVTQQANTDTGFSGTLFKSTDGEYVISFRSTEFVEDNIRDGGTNNSIHDYGWAFGQISDMMKWFDGLRSSGQLPADAHFTVTGYSLGGHLATAFAMLAQDQGWINQIDHVYLFNSAGTGGLNNGNSLDQVINRFDQLWNNGQPDENLLMSLAQSVGSGLYDQAITAANNAEAEWRRVRTLTDSTGEPNQSFLGAMGDWRFHLAMKLAAEGATTGAPFGAAIPFTDTLYTNTGLSDKITEVAGSGFSAVAVSGYRHTTDQAIVQIEDQPLWRGTPEHIADLIDNFNASFKALAISDHWDVNDFGDTHSLVLMIDSLTVMDTFAALDTSVTLEQLNRLIQSANNRNASTEPGQQGQSEGNTLEILVDKLYKAVVGIGQAPELHNATYIDSKTGATVNLTDGNSWSNIESRNALHNKLAEIKTAIKTEIDDGKSFALTLLSDANSSGMVAKATQNDAEGLAYRFALVELNPFVVAGLDYVSANANGELNLYNSANGTGDLTEQYLRDRAAMLDWKLKYDGGKHDYNDLIVANYLSAVTLVTASNPIIPSAYLASEAFKLY